MIEPVWINTGVVVAGLLIGYGKFSGKVAMKSEVEKKLYHADGTTIYVPRSECRQDREDCTQRLCKKLDEIRTAQVEHDKKHEAISEFIGFVRGKNG
jgi:hypothetical protein